MKHSITHSGTDWLLKIWEPAPTTDNRELPFLYKINLRFPTEQKARDALNDYKKLNRDLKKHELLMVR